MHFLDVTKRRNKNFCTSLHGEASRDLLYDNMFTSKATAIWFSAESLDVYICIKSMYGSQCTNKPKDPVSIYVGVGWELPRYG